MKALKLETKNFKMKENNDVQVTSQSVRWKKSGLEMVYFYNMEPEIYLSLRDFVIKINRRFRGL